MQTALIKGGVEFAKLIGTVAVTFTACMVGIHLAAKVTPVITDGLDGAIGAATGAVVGTQAAVTGLLAKKEQTQQVAA